MAEMNIKSSCEMCSQSKTIAFCHQCTYYLCSECVRCHHTMKVFAGHNVLTLEELKEGGAKYIPPPIMIPTCKGHDEPLKIYCYDCNNLICRDCVLIDHAGHKYEFVKKAAAESRNELEGKLAALKEVQASLCKATEAVKATKKEIVDRRTTLTTTIKQSLAQLRNILENRESALLAEVTSGTDEKTGKLDVQEKELVTTSAVFQSLIDVVRQDLQDSTTDEELLTAQQQISNRIETEMKNHQENPITFDPTSVEIDKCFTVSQRCDRLAAQIHCLLDSCSAVEINQPTKVSIRVPTLPNKRDDQLFQRSTPELSVELKSCVDESITDTECVQTQDDGTYEVEFTPQDRGRYKLSVSVNNVPVAGSPFPVFVKVPPTELMDPVRTISDERLKVPFGVTFNSCGEVLVAAEGQCVVYDSLGTKLRSFKPSAQYVACLCGIAVDGEDNVYVADDKNDCLYKFNKKGKQVSKVGSHGNKHCEFDYPKGVAVIRDRVYICDSRNNRIQVFTTDLKFVRVIGTKGSGNGQFDDVYDIAHDELGQAYVCDSENDCVQVFDRDMNFLYSFNKKGSSGQLECPVGICLSDQFVFVAEFSCRCVSVFLQSGEFVTSFGGVDCEDGKCIDPCGISCDCDGFVYVCDFSNNMVQIF